MSLLKYFFVLQCRIILLRLSSFFSLSLFLLSLSRLSLCPLSHSPLLAPPHQLYPQPAYSDIQVIRRRLIDPRHTRRQITPLFKLHNNHLSNFTGLPQPGLTQLQWINPQGLRIPKLENGTKPLNIGTTKARLRTDVPHNIQRFFGKFVGRS